MINLWLLSILIHPDVFSEGSSQAQPLQPPKMRMDNYHVLFDSENLVLQKMEGVHSSYFAVSDVELADTKAYYNSNYKFVMIQIVICKCIHAQQYYTCQ